MPATQHRSSFDSISYGSGIRGIFGRVLQADECLEFHQFALQAKINQGQTVAKHVVDPSDFSRFGNDLKTAIQQSLIEAVSRAK